MKKRRIIKHERALQDLEHRSEYIRQDSPRAALRFLDAAQATFQQLADMPYLGGRHEHGHPALSDLRFFPLASGFKAYIVFYRPSTDGIEILRVLHGAQDIDLILADDLGIADVDPRQQEEG